MRNSDWSSDVFSSDLESEKPTPGAIVPHPEANFLWQAKIRALSAILRDGPEGQPLREVLGGLVERVALLRDEGAENGFSLKLEGVLTELLSSLSHGAARDRVRQQRTSSGRRMYSLDVLPPLFPVPKAADLGDDAI